MLMCKTEGEGVEGCGVGHGWALTDGDSLVFMINL